MSNLERRVNDLEVVLGELLAQNVLAARRAEMENQFIKNQITGLRDEMKEFKDEVKGFMGSVDKVIIELKDTTLELKDTTIRLSKEMSESKAETNRVIAQLSKEMSESKAETNRVIAQLSKEMSESKAETNRVIAQLSKEMSESKAETNRIMAQLSKEMSESKAEMNKKWGDLANKLGTIVEDIVAPNIPTIAKKYFGVEHVQRLMMNLYIESETLKKAREFDLILVAKDVVLLNETKTTIRQNYLEEFIQSQAEFFEFFPELKGKKLIPIFSSMRFNDQQLAYLTKHKTYAMSMSGNTMELLNFEEIPLT